MADKFIELEVGLTHSGYIYELNVAEEEEEEGPSILLLNYVGLFV